MRQLYTILLFVLSVNIISCDLGPTTHSDDYKVHGKIVDQEGKPIEGAKVETKGYHYFNVSSDNFSDYYHSTETDEDGEYTATISTMYDDNSGPTELRYIPKLHFKISYDDDTDEISIIGVAAEEGDDGIFEIPELTFDP